jgi:hypothetical protein
MDLTERAKRLIGELQITLLEKDVLIEDLRRRLAEAEAAKGE